MQERKRIGELLVEEGALEAHQLELALSHQRRWGGRLGRAIVHLGFLGEDQVLSAVGTQLGVPYVTLWDKVVPRDVLALLPERVVRGRRAFPIARLRETRRGPLVVALSDPADLAILDELSFAAGLEIRPVLASEEELDRAIELHLGSVPGDAPEEASRPAEDESGQVGAQGPPTGIVH